MCCFIASKPMTSSKTVTYKRMNLDSYFRHICITQNEKNKLNIRAKTLKLLRKNIDVNLHDLVSGNGFFKVTSNIHVAYRKK